MSQKADRNPYKIDCKNKRNIKKTIRSQRKCVIHNQTYKTKKMTNKKIILKKTLIASFLFICTTVVLGTTFWKMNGSESNDWILYIQEWSFPVLIFITIPFICGMWYTSSSSSSFLLLLAKVLINTIIYAMILFVIVWTYSEPKPVDMEAYKHACMRILPLTCSFCTFGHFIGKTIWMRWRTKNLREIFDRSKEIERMKRKEAS